VRFEGIAFKDIINIDLIIVNCDISVLIGPEDGCTRESISTNYVLVKFQKFDNKSTYKGFRQKIELIF